MNDYFKAYGNLYTQAERKELIAQSMKVFRERAKKSQKEIADAIGTQLDRGVTILDGHGWYTGQEMKVLCILARKRKLIEFSQCVKINFHSVIPSCSNFRRSPAASFYSLVPRDHTTF